MDTMKPTGQEEAGPADAGRPERLTKEQFSRFRTYLLMQNKAHRRTMALCTAACTALILLYFTAILLFPGHGEETGTERLFSLYSAAIALVIWLTALCGKTCGVLAVWTVFNIHTCTSGFSYYEIVLLAASLITNLPAHRGWFRSLRGTLAAVAVITGITGVSNYVGIGVLIQRRYTPEALADCMCSVLPAVMIACAVLWAFFRLAPPRARHLFPESDFSSGEIRSMKKRFAAKRGTHIGKKILLLIIAEAVLIGISGTALAGALLQDLNAALSAEDSALFMTKLVQLLVMEGIPVTFLAVDFIRATVEGPMVLMAMAVNDSSRRQKERDYEPFAEIPSLGIASKDEIGVLYRSLQRAEKHLQAYLESVEENIRLERKSAHLTQGFMLALAKAVDAKDHYTSGHSERVAAYSREIARRLGKTTREQDEIYTMGLLHDIGKIGVSEAIINKNGRLTDDEFAEIKAHPVKGWEILRNVSELPRLATGARWHHERYDGRGYPDGLSGSGIPEEARIIAVADAYDAMTSKRAYSGIRPQETVRAEIERCKGSQFDPAIADVMLSMIDDDTEYRLHEGA